MTLSLAILLIAAPSCEAAMTQAEMNRCAADDFAMADLDLNAQWKVTAAVMRAQDAARDPADKRPGYYAALLAAQRAWLAYRDAHCVSEGYIMRGGSAEAMMIAGCKATLSRARTDQLKTLAEVQ